MKSSILLGTLKGRRQYETAVFQLKIDLGAFYGLVIRLHVPV
jgi:hypothetical protein